MLSKPQFRVPLTQTCPCGSGRTYRRCYRRWPDMALPALDGHTLREAARDLELRPRLVSLLKEMELTHSRASAPMDSFDLSFLWAELGLRRP